MTTNGSTPTLTIHFPSDVESAVSQAECAELAGLAEGLTVLECGAWLGRTTIVLAQAAASLHSVDWHRGDPHAGEGSTIIEYISNLNRYGALANPRVSIHVGRFDEVLPVLKPGAFDVVFLDGFHSYEQVRDDIVLLHPLVAAGGTLAFHDYGVEQFGVTKAVDEMYEVDHVVETLAVVRLGG